METVIDHDQPLGICPAGMAPHRLDRLAEQFRPDHAVGVNLPGL